VAPISAEQAGADLAGLAGEHELTLWETFLTDLAGHGRRGVTAKEALARLDGLLGGLLAAMPDGLTVLLTSDHGNLEESTHGRHTRNPVPLLAVGPEAPSFADLDRLDQVAPRLLERLTARR
jgi:phosphopentomutase